ERLAGLAEDGPAREFERVIAEVDRAWRQAPWLPRELGDDFERRFAAARAEAAELTSRGLRRRWESECDALAARLALCRERERTVNADFEARSQALGPLPRAWEQALARQFGRPPGSAPDPALDGWLLRLEDSLDLPAPADRQAERRELKLQALKSRLETRAAKDGERNTPGAWFEAVLEQGGLGAEQAQRLDAIVAALRRAAPGTAVG
ncbi:MAG: hypothetical protein KGL43_07795, partial [Burkholderiales bacterium]|nr:hypothetical protein [Burkholderiales bacterium]